MQLNLKLPDNYQVLEEVTDLFLIINQTILKSSALKHSLVCIYSRTSFIFNFISILINGEPLASIEPFSRNIMPVQASKDYFVRPYPLLSQKVFHIDYFGAIKEE